jgi:hypothetical protein
MGEQGGRAAAARQKALMPFSELRAQGWRITAIALGVLAVALLIVGLFLWGSLGAARTDAAKQGEKARAAELQAKALSDALARDGVSDGFTDKAAHATDVNAAEINQRLAHLEARKNDRPPVPVVCPEPDPEFVRESAEAASRIHSAEGRLRNLRVAQGQHAD